jgi:myo-inositol-1(or 4)-monophosphatase
MNRNADLRIIDDALELARSVLAGFSHDSIDVRSKDGGSPVTEADDAVDAALKGALLQEGEGWLSEETVDDPDRLDRSRVWVVDPIDGTKEFIRGVPEWCVSIGLVEEGRAVAGGILNPMTDCKILGAIGEGVTAGGTSVSVRKRASLADAEIMASRSEIRRGEWERFGDLHVIPCGSVAWKLGLVAIGRADATWTLCPKNEWDIAAGVALVEAAGGVAFYPDGSAPRFNRRKTLIPGLVICGHSLENAVRSRLEIPGTPKVNRNSY